MRNSFHVSGFSYMLITSAASSALLVLAFPNFDVEMLAWIGLVPLFFAIEGQRPRVAFISAYITGVLFFLGTVYWLVHVTFPGMIAVALYLAVYFGFFGLGVSLIATPAPGARDGQTLSRIRDPRWLGVSEKRPNLRNIQAYPIGKILIIPALWVTLEWLRSHLLTGFGWVLLGHSQTRNLEIIQMADLAGAYGVSFLVVLVNYSIYMTIKGLKDKRYETLYLTVALSLVFLTVAYGTFRLKNIFSGERFKIAVVQGNIPQNQKWDQKFREEILGKYESITEEAAKQKPDLVIWPETSVPAFIELEKDVHDRISRLARNIHAPILVGAPREGSSPPGALYNSAILFGYDGKIAGSYDKLHLVPFGEYVPFKRFLSFVERLAPSPIGDFSHGMESTVFSFFIERRYAKKDINLKFSKKVRFSCLICFEDIFPDMAREFVKNNADFLVNITNDAWFKNSSAPYQHAQNSVFRAIENRVNVVRAANTGLSCFIDQKGEVVEAVEDGGKKIFIDGFRVREIVLAKTRTLYTIYGDVFAYACMLSTIAYFIFRWRRRYDTTFSGRFPDKAVCE